MVRPVGPKESIPDEVLAVWFPRHKAFIDLHLLDNAKQLWSLRVSCVEDARIYRCSATDYSMKNVG